MGLIFNSQCERHAKALIAAGKVDTTSRWSIDAKDEDAMLGEPADWDGYSEWFLGREENAAKGTKEAWKYPIGKGGKVYRSALIAIRQRAGQYHAMDIFEGAAKLIEAMDKGREDFAEAQHVAPIEIFRTGTHVDTGGREITFGAADLRASAQAYSPGVHEAPLVVGHPEMDAPAYGWVIGLGYSGGSLFAEPSEVEPQFADLVRSGRFKKISASFYRPDARQNPVPGVYYLRHVGFLGAAPPALKGLRPVQFSGSETDTVNFELDPTTSRRDRMAGRVEYHEGTGKTAVGLFHRLREHVMRKHGQEEADDVIPREEIARLEQEAQREGEAERKMQAEQERLTKEAEGLKPGDAAAHLALQRKADDLKRREAEVEQKEKSLMEKERAARVAGHAAYCEALVKEGRLLPALQENALAILVYAEADAGKGVVEFGEGANRKALLPVEAVKLLLSSQPKVVSYGEAVSGSDAIPDSEDGAREAKISEFMEKHKGVSYRDAMIEVSREFPNLFGLSVKAKRA